jgi:2'-5' RNA ligase
VSDERARLFVALELPEDVRRELVGWRASALGPDAELRLVPAEALHVTLCFLGWRTAGEIDQVAAACEQAAAAEPVELSLGDPVWLPRRRPSVLAVELADPRGALTAAQSALSDALQAGGWYAPESRPFFAHVTVARVGKGGRAPRERLSAPEPIAFTGSTVTLYRSRLSAAGAGYDRSGRLRLSPTRSRSSAHFTTRRRACTPATSSMPCAPCSAMTSFGTCRAGARSPVTTSASRRCSPTSTCVAA